MQNFLFSTNAASQKRPDEICDFIRYGCLPLPFTANIGERVLPPFHGQLVDMKVNWGCFLPG
jgi:hypothetical protein